MIRKSLLSLFCCLFVSSALSADYSAWKHRGEIWLLTTPEGADLPVSEVVENFPVLVRLHRDFFDFSQPLPEGADLRFATSTGESIAYQVEEWDATAGEASIWVRVPKITGNARQSLRIYWGNKEAAAESNGSAVFDRSNGHVAVWHMNDPLREVTNTLATTFPGTTMSAGMIGRARHLPGGSGIFAGDKIETLPSGSESHSTEAWFRAEKPNTTIIGWGNEHAQGKVVMQFRSPPHVRMDCYFSGGNVAGKSRLQLNEWTHVVHTYQKGEAKLYINGVLDGNNQQGPPLSIKSPARLFIGGWYHNFDFVGDIDEVRVSNVVRSAAWIKLQYENQKAQQTFVGPVIQGTDRNFAVAAKQLTVAEGETATVSATAAGAQKVYWIWKQGEQESVVATDRFSYAIQGERVVGNQTAQLIFKAVYPDGIKTEKIDVTIREAIAEPEFTLPAPPTWDGRSSLELAPQIANLAALPKSASPLRYVWKTENVAVIKEVAEGKLVLKSAQGNGPLRITLAVDNGGVAIEKTAEIQVKQPATADARLPRPIAEQEQPENNQFIARDGNSREGTLVHAGRLEATAESLFVRLYVGERLITTVTGKPSADLKYSLAVKVPAGLVQYRTEFGAKTGDTEAILHTAANLVCGDVFLICGQSNAVATDFGKENPLVASPWVRTFGATDGGPQGSRLKQWAPAEARSPGGKAEIGYWGMELGRRLVESEKLPICLINGAVGGTRIDQHQRNSDDPTDVRTIYGRLLWRVQQARLTHGVRAVIWHQGENDQGADGPTGGFGYETYQQYFVDLAASWKTDYPNLERYYAFQIWPKSCAMGINGSDNRLREVQRTLPQLFSNLSVMSTLGVKPPGGCHFPAAGYAEFARLLTPLVQRDLYGAKFEQPIDPANLLRVYFANQQRDELVLEFTQPVVWQESLTSQFHLIGEPKQVQAGSAQGNRLTLKLASPSKATKLTYLDSAAWNPDNLLLGKNGIAALTFCEVTIGQP